MATSADKKPIAYISDSATEQNASIAVYPFKAFNSSVLQAHRAVFIEESSILHRHVCKRIRQSPKTSVYLKPVFLNKTSDAKIIEYDNEVLDGICETEDIAAYYKYRKAFIDKVNDRIRECINRSADVTNEYDLFLKVLRYLYVRSTELSAVRYPKSIFGYSYPRVGINLGTASYQEFRIVDFLAEKNLIEGDFVDSIHSCNHCYSSFLNFREICTNCGSPQIASEDLVHHFKCGYVGPESDFISKGQTVCPKCRKPLNHIGVDFDRPSTVFTCSACEQNFQEPDVDVLCINCGKTTQPANLITTQIKKYRLTALGENSAVNGIVYSLKDELKESLDIVDQEKFRMVLNLEIERIKRYKVSKSSVAMLSLTNYLEVALKYGHKTTDLSREIGKQIRSVIRTTDILTFYNDTVLLLLFTETPLSGAKIAIQRLTENIKHLLKENLKTDVTLEFVFFELTDKHSYEGVLKELIKDE